MIRSLPLRCSSEETGCDDIQRNKKKISDESSPPEKSFPPIYKAQQKTFVTGVLVAR